MHIAGGGRKSKDGADLVTLRAEDFRARFGAATDGEYLGLCRRRGWRFFPKRLDDHEECPLHVYRVLRGRLDKVESQFLGQVLPFLVGYRPGHFFVALVADQNRREPVLGAEGLVGRHVAGAQRRGSRVFYQSDEVMEHRDLVERRSVFDAVHKHKSVAVSDPLVS